METVFRDVQVEQIARKLKLPKLSVENIWKEYVSYLTEKINSGNTIKFLNVCYLRVNGNENKEHETLAYVATEIANKLHLGKEVTLRVLTTFEEILIQDLQKFYSYSIRGLVRIRLERNVKGEYKVRIKKSTVYSGHDVYVMTLGSFKRKAEIL